MFKHYSFKNDLKLEQSSPDLWQVNNLPVCFKSFNSKYRTVQKSHKIIGFVLNMLKIKQMIRYRVDVIKLYLWNGQYLDGNVNCIS